MIEIITYGGISLDISKDTDFSIEYENPIFSEGRMPVPYSTEISFPTSPSNNAAFGYWPGVVSPPSRLSLPASIYCSGILIMSGRLVFDSVEESCLKYSFSGSSASESFEALDIADFAPQPSIQKEAVQSVKRGEYLFVKAPLMINEEHVADAIYDGRDDDVEGCGASGKYVNFYTDEEPSRFVPAFPFGQFVSNIFRRNALAISVDAEVSEWLDYVHIIGQYKPKVTDGGEGIWYDNASGIMLGQTLPDVSAADFLTNVLKMFCAAVFYDGSAFAMKPLSAVIASYDAENWDDQIGDIVDFKRESISAYTFGYSNDEDNRYSDGQLDGDIESGNIKVSANLGTLSNLLGHDEYTTVYHSPSGYIYSGRKKACSITTDRTGGSTTTLEIEQTLIDAIFHPVKKVSIRNNHEDDSESDATLDFKLVKCIPEYVNTTERNIYANINKVAPVLSFPEAGNEREREMYVGLVIHNQMTDLGIVFDKDDDSDEFNSAKSLAPQYLYDKFHHGFAEWLMKDKIFVTGQVKLTAFELAAFKMYRKVYFRGREWIVKKLSVTMSALSDILDVTGEFVSV